MSHSVIRLACYLAVVCGVSLRHIALLFSRPVPDSHYQVVDQTMDR